MKTTFFEYLGLAVERNHTPYHFTSIKKLISINYMQCSEVRNCEQDLDKLLTELQLICTSNKQHTSAKRGFRLIYYRGIRIYI